MVAVVSVVAICIVLALITRVHFAMSETQNNFESVVVDYAEQVREKSEAEPNFAPERMITVPNGPSFARVESFVPNKDQPDYAEVPELISKEPLVIEELEFQNRFEEEPEPIKVEPAPTIARKSPPIESSSSAQAELAERDKDTLAGKVVQQASVASRFVPHYPRSARRKGLQGRVVVTVTVGASGEVSSCQISESSGYSTLDQSAVSAARRYRFFPAKNGLGQAISVRKAIPFNFQLTN